jgi:hypothetical protein
MKPKQVRKSFWSADPFKGRAILLNKASDAVPKDMPRQLWYTDGVKDYTFEITSWQLNAAGAPKREEFTKPEEREGWRVDEWPFRRKK